MLVASNSVDDPGRMKTQGATARVEYSKVIAACDIRLFEYNSKGLNEYLIAMTHIFCTVLGPDGYHVAKIQAMLCVSECSVQFLANNEPDILVRTMVSTLLKTGLGSLKPHSQVRHERHRGTLPSMSPATEGEIAAINLVLPDPTYANAACHWKNLARF